MRVQARRPVFVIIGVAFLFASCLSEARSTTARSSSSQASSVDARSSDARLVERRAKRPVAKTKAKSKSKAPAASSSATSKKLSAPVATWQSLARKVGQSEEFRDRAIREIKRVPHLQAQLYRALATDDRPLALEVIGALNMRSLLPDLLTRASQDSDGFTVLAVNSLMTSTNSAQILRLWSTSLAKPDSISTPVAIAMLEPMARMNWKLPRSTLTRLADTTSPDTRSSLLSYLRVMALRNGVVENPDLVTEMTRAPEVQIRLQAISVSAEVTAQPRMFHLSSVKSMEELNSLCLRESGSSLKEACLSFLAVGVAGTP